MDWKDEFLIPPIANMKISFRLIIKNIKIFFEVAKHALLPHALDPKPVKELPDIDIDDKNAEFLKTSEIIYKSSLERIEKLEKKAFGLISYITALFTIIVFIYTQLGFNNGAGWLIIPVSLLLLTLIISFRCLSVKTIHQIFIDDIYCFENPMNQFKKGALCKAYLSAAIQNEAKANSVADMLNAARMILASAFSMFLIISFLIILFSQRNNTPNKGLELQQQQVKSIESIEHILQNLQNNIILSDTFKACLCYPAIKMETLYHKIDSSRIINYNDKQRNENQPNK